MFFKKLKTLSARNYDIPLDLQDEYPADFPYFEIMEKDFHKNIKEHFQRTMIYGIANSSVNIEFMKTKIRVVM